MSEADDRAKKVKNAPHEAKAEGRASVALAITAGVFLACQRGASEVSRLVTRREARRPMARATQTTRARPPTPRLQSRTRAERWCPTPACGGQRKHACEARWQGERRLRDVNEHRKGMPVRDNLLE